ncbi:MAG: phage portal protein [Ruminiclostridium sp.]
MSICGDISAVFPDLKIVDISDYYSMEIAEAKGIYQCHPPWENVPSSNLGKKKSRKRAMLNTAKIVCDKLATLTFSEQCDINIENEQTKEYVMQVLEDNGFWEKFPEFLSRAFALGGGAIKTYIEKNAVKLSYVNADRFYPISWDNRSIKEAVFFTDYIKGGKYYHIFELHRFTDGGYVVENKAYCSDSKDSLGKEETTELPSKSVFKSVKTPLFAYFKPAIGNNKRFDVPLGLSVFANSADTLKSIDILFDSLQREFVLGKKRIIVPSEMVKVEYDDNGNAVRYFDSNDEVYQALTCNEAEKLQIHDNTYTLRVQEHIDGLNALLNMLCLQIGLSPGALSYDKIQGEKTATEVISEEKDTQRTANNNKNLITEMLEDVINAIISCAISLQVPGVIESEVSISWQDNVITDDNTRIENNIKLYQANLISRKSALMDIFGYDESQAEAEIEQIVKEADINGLNVDDLYGQGE